MRWCRQSDCQYRRPCGDKADTCTPGEESGIKRIQPAAREQGTATPTVGALGDIDISTCDACGGAVRVISSIEDPVVIPKAFAVLTGQALKQILAHLQRKAESKEFNPLPESRAPPQTGLFG